MSNEERIYTIKLTPEKFKIARYCLTEYERLVRQKVARKIDLDEHIPPEVLSLLAEVGELNDLIYQEHVKVDYLGGVSHGKQC
jgi:hypothetical protein